jgi:ornithine cyclodeaminase/alanine dehydrogenase-like protein (mu-crystallin family)
VLSLHAHNGGFHVKAGLLDLERSYFGAKVNGNFPDNGPRFGLPTIQGVIVLCDAGNGTPLAMMDSRDITALRTGAATAVAAKYLARRDSRIVTICGCGVQGRVQLKSLCRLFPFQTVFAYDQREELAAQFALELALELKIPVTPVVDLAVSPGTFIAAVGADSPQKQEIHPSLMQGSKIVCDILEQCAVMGDLHHALEACVVKRADVHAELGEVVAGKKPGRESDDETIVFDSTGMALQDVAAAAFVYEKAARQGSGVQFRFAA